MQSWQKKTVAGFTIPFLIVFHFRYLVYFILDIRDETLLTLLLSKTMFVNFDQLFKKLFLSWKFVPVKWFFFVKQINKRVQVLENFDKQRDIYLCSQTLFCCRQTKLNFRFSCHADSIHVDNKSWPFQWFAKFMPMDIGSKKIENCIFALIFFHNLK